MNERCKQITPMLAAYSLDALDRADKALVDRHLPGCKECQSELRRYQAFAAEMLLSTPPASPPKRLRQKIADAAFSAEDLTARPERTRHPRQRFALIASVVGILVLAVINILQLNRSQQLAAAERELIEQNLAFENALHMMTSSEAVVVAVGEGEITGTFVFIPSGHQAVLNLRGLDPIQEEHSYQIWLIRPDQSRVSAGVFQFNDQNDEFVIEILSPESLSTYIGMGITLEPAGGSSGPTGPRVVGIEL